MAIAFKDNVGSGYNSVAGSLTVAGTTTSGSNLVLLVFIHVFGTPGATTVTWNGDALTQVETWQRYGTANDYCGLFYLANPDVGSYNLVVNSGASNRNQACAVTYSGVNTSNPIDTSTSGGANSGTSVSSSLASINNGGWHILFCGCNGTSLTGGSNAGSERSTQTSNGEISVFDNNSQTSPAGILVQECSWTISTSHGYIQAVLNTLSQELVINPIVGSYAITGVEQSFPKSITVYTSNHTSITVDHTMVAGDLTDYPMYVDLSLLDDNFWNNIEDGGGSIRIFIDNRECAREIVSCDTATKTGEVHVLIPSLSSSVDTVIDIYFGNGDLSDYSPTDTYGSQAVWVNYAYVAHLENKNLSKPAGAQFTEGGSPAYANSKLGKGLHVSSKNDYLYLANVFNSFSTKNWIIQVWFKQIGIVSSNVYTDQVGVWGGGIGDPFVYLNLRASRYHERYINLTNDRTDTRSQVDNSFVQLRSTYTQPRSVKLYANNSSGGGQTLASDMVNLHDGLLRIGSFYGSSPADFERYIDEFRIANTGQSSEYYTTEYNNQSNPWSFYSVGESSGGFFSSEGKNITTHTFFKPILEVGEFILTGIDQALKSLRKLITEKGTYTVTGISAIFGYIYFIVAQSTSFSLSSVNASFYKFLKLTGTVGSYNISGMAQGFKKSLNLVTQATSFSITGINTWLRRIYTLTSSSGSFVFTGIASALLAFFFQIKCKIVGVETKKPINTLTKVDKPKNTIINTSSKPMLMK